MKTHKGTAKRFRIGARGRVKVTHSSANHLKSGKSAKRRRRIRRAMVVTGAFAARVREGMGRARSARKGASEGTGAAGRGSAPRPRTGTAGERG